MRLALVLLAACGVPADVDVADGTYHPVVTARGGDAILFLHAHDGSGARFAESETVRATLEDRGLVGLFPEGMGGNWKVGHHVDDIARDDVAFLAEVAADARSRFDLRDVYLSGHSEGASMVYEVLCAGGDDFAGFAPFSGSFWNPDGTCAPTEARVRHVHGRADGTWPMNGEATGIGVKGGVDDGLDRVRAPRACPAEPTPVSDASGLDCVEWAGCGVRRCTHAGGHGLPDGWLAGVAGWIDAP